MLEELAMKRRAILEQELDATYEGKLVRLPDEEVVRVDVMGIEWEGKFAFTVIVQGNSKRRTFDYTEFVEKAVVLR